MFLIIIFTLFNQVASVSPPCTVLGNDRCIRVQNNCPSTIWPALSMQVGNQTTYDGFLTGSRGHVDYHFPNNVTHLQVWARTDCITLGPFQCETGDCGSNIHCDGVHNVTLPVSMAEICPNPFGEEKYDVTLFNGFNIPVTITPTVINPPKFLDKVLCSPLGNCDHSLTNATFCPKELLAIVNDDLVGCFHPCTVFKTPEYCCTGEYASPEKCLSTPQGVVYDDIFKRACPTARVTPFDGPVGTCVGVASVHVFYTVTFC